MKIIAENSVSVVDLVSELKRGKTLVYPTETSYGLGCDPTNLQAVEKIFAIKQRDPQKPLLVVISELDQIRPYIVWDERLEKINDRYWPGPLTVLVRAVVPNVLVPGVISEDNWLAFRVTSQPFARTIVQNLGVPLVSTSANRAGESALYSAEIIKDYFSEQTVSPDIFIDAGELVVTPASTIIKLLPTGFSVVRQGLIHVEL